MPTAAERAIAAHRAQWGEPSLVARAPGRVNLIGEHTDYNDGFALPMALPFDTVVALGDSGDRRDGIVTAISDEFVAVDIDPHRDPTHVPTWARHLSGVVHVVGDSGFPSAGWRAAIATDIPVGAGLSSSAALDVALIALTGTAAGTYVLNKAVQQSHRRRSPPGRATCTRSRSTCPRRAPTRPSWSSPLRSAAGARRSRFRGPTDSAPGLENISGTTSFATTIDAAR